MIRTTNPLDCTTFSRREPSSRLAASRQKETQIRGFFEKQREEAESLHVQMAKFMRLESDWEETKKLCDILDERIREINVGEDTGAPVSEDYGPRDNGFNGIVKGVQLAIADAAENSDHLVKPEDAIRVAMARQ